MGEPAIKSDEDLMFQYNTLISFEESSDYEDSPNNRRSSFDLSNVSGRIWMESALNEDLHFFPQVLVSKRNKYMVEKFGANEGEEPKSPPESPIVTLKEEL